MMLRSTATQKTSFLFRLDISAALDTVDQDILFQRIYDSDALTGQVPMKSGFHCALETVYMFQHVVLNQKFSQRLHKSKFMVDSTSFFTCPYLALS